METRKDFDRGTGQGRGRGPGRGMERETGQGTGRGMERETGLIMGKEKVKRPVLTGCEGLDRSRDGAGLDRSRDEAGLSRDDSSPGRQAGPGGPAGAFTREAQPQPRDVPRKSPRRLSPAAALLALLLLVTTLGGCNNAQEVQGNQELLPVISAAVATRGDLQQEITLTGNVSPRVEIRVLPETSGRVKELAVEVGQGIERGDLIMELENRDQGLQLDQAKAALGIAEAQLAEARAGARPESVRTAEANVEQYREAVRIAEARLAEVKAGASPEAIKTAESNVEQAKAAVKIAESQLAEVRAGARPETVRTAEAQVEQARAALGIAEARLAEAQAGARSQDLQQLQQAVDSARLSFQQDQADYQRMKGLHEAGAISQQQLEGVRLKMELSERQYISAQAAYSAAEEGARAETVQVAQANVEQARKGLEIAQAQLADVKAGARPEAIQTAEAAVEQARAMQQIAESQLAELKAGARPEMIMTAEAQVEQAKAILRIAESQLAEVRAGARPETLRMMEAQVEQARVPVEMARNQYEKTFIRAPVSGLVSSLDLKEGDLASPGQAAALVTDLESVYIEASIPEGAINRVSLETPVQVYVPAVQEGPFPGIMGEISPAAPAGSRAYPAKIIVDNRDGLLRGGMYARAEIPLERRQEVLLIPQVALLEEGNGYHVWKVQDGRVARQEIELGLRSNAQVEVLSGLSPGDLVVTRGQRSLAEGMAVEVQLDTGTPDHPAFQVAPGAGDSDPGTTGEETPGSSGEEAPGSGLGETGNGDRETTGDNGETGRTGDNGEPGRTGEPGDNGEAGAESDQEGLSSEGGYPVSAGEPPINARYLLVGAGGTGDSPRATRQDSTPGAIFQYLAANLQGPTPGVASQYMVTPRQDPAPGAVSQRLITALQDTVLGATSQYMIIARQDPTPGAISQCLITARQDTVLGAVSQCQAATLQGPPPGALSRGPGDDPPGAGSPFPGAPAPAANLNHRGGMTG